MTDTCENCLKSFPEDLLVVTRVDGSSRPPHFAVNARSLGDLRLCPGCRRVLSKPRREQCLCLLCTARSLGPANISSEDRLHTVLSSLSSPPEGRSRGPLSSDWMTPEPETIPWLSPSLPYIRSFDRPRHFLCAGSRRP